MSSQEIPDIYMYSKKCGIQKVEKCKKSKCDTRYEKNVKKNAGYISNQNHLNQI